MRTIDFVTVATILRSPYHLVYALPLLFISITLLFAGTFITLDRTRSFPSSSDVKTKPPFYRLESGIGGLAIGWVLGVHTSTLVALLVLNQTETAHLGPPVFLVVWLSSTIGFTLVCGRWKYAALGFGGILGGGCIGLLLAISLHPSLLARYILTVVCIILVTTGGLAPYPRVRHTSLRVGTSAAGAVGIINACAILGGPSNTKLASWSSAWLHLVLPHDSDTAELQWDAGKSKGLTAAAFFLWMIGAACDWWLRRRIGEDPDEAWDGVLGSYSTNFPPEASRIGTFTPTKSPWARLVDKLRFSSDNTNVEKPLLFPPDLQLARSTPAAPAGIKPPPVFRPRKPGTFTPDPYESDSDSDLGEGEKVARRAMKERKWTTSTNFSDTTLVNPRPERLRKHHGIMGGAFERGYMPPILTSSPSGTHIEYGDKDAERSPELNMGSHRIEPSRDDDKDWRPVFLKRSESIRSSKAEMVDSIESQDVTTARTPGTQTPAYHYSGPTTPIRGPTSSYVHGTVPTPGLVPATPSLIYAMDRVSQAQRLAYARGTDASAEQHYQAGSDTAISKMGGGIEGLPSTGRHGHERGWKGFWAEVQQKAAQP
ncbi:hypothetical protein RhiJN_05494 [Ceratobasidium sp. AG-Ba]|nr:hypothetical protein RhiJN_05494 [Ceratobasidium sp. AG-Ba]